MHYGTNSTDFADDADEGSLHSEKSSLDASHSFDSRQIEKKEESADDTDYADFRRLL